MNITAEIQAIKKELDKLEDEHLIRAIKSLLAYAKEKNDIAGYAPDGTALTKEMIRKRVKAASKRVKDGKYTSHEEGGIAKRS